MSLALDVVVLVAAVITVLRVGPLAWRQVRDASRADPFFRSFPRMIPAWLIFVAGAVIGGFGDSQQRPVLSAAGLVIALPAFAWFGGLVTPVVLGRYFGPGDDDQP